MDKPQVENTMTDNPDNAIGNRLKELRKLRKLSMSNLAQLAGVNINTISLIENAKISPSVSNLYRLAQAMDITISQFFEESDSHHRVFVTRNNNRPILAVDGAIIENLAYGKLKDLFQSYVVTLKPGYSTDEKSIHHEGFELVYCLSGSLDYMVDGIRHSLAAGDSLIFDSSQKHCWNNSSHHNSSFVLVILPKPVQNSVENTHFEK